VAGTLVERIRDMGLPAERPSLRTPPQTNDILIWGYFISLDEGSAVQRVVIGFGSGSAQLTTAVEVYQMTATGLRKLGWVNVDASGSKAPGEALGHKH
jgi:transglutaminase-like putative cysteine protease